MPLSANAVFNPAPPPQGTIVWERWQLEEFLQARKRVCHLRNICWANGRLTMSVLLFPQRQTSRCSHVTLRAGTFLKWQVISRGRNTLLRGLGSMAGTGCCTCTRSRR